MPQVENINSTFEPILRGISPTWNPNKLSTPFVIGNKPVLIAFAFDVGVGEFYFMSSLNENKLALFANVESGVTTINLQKTINGEQENHSWTNDVKEGTARFVILLDSGYMRVYSFDTLVKQEAFLIEENYEMSLFCYAQNVSLSTLSMFRVIEESFNDEQVKQLIDGGLFNEKYSPISFKKRCTFNFDLSTINFNRWNSLSPNQAYLFSNSIFNIVQGNIGNVQHHYIEGFNPFLSVHKPLPTETIDYARTITEELVVRPLMSGVSPLVLTKISKVLASEAEGFYLMDSTVKLPRNWNLFFYMSFDPDSNREMFSLFNDENSDIELSFDISKFNDGGWHYVTLVKYGVDLRLFVDGEFVERKELQFPIAGIEAPILLNNNAGFLILAKAYNCYLTDAEIRMFYNLGDPILFDDKDYKKFLVFDFNDNSLSSLAWEETVSAYNAFANRNLDVIFSPKVQGVGYSDYSTPI